MMKAYIRTDKENPIEVVKQISSAGDIFYVDENNNRYEEDDLYIVDETLRMYNSDIVPFNIAHFQGKSLSVYSELQKQILDLIELSSKPEGVAFITCYTDNTRSMLKSQFERYDIPLINAAENTNIEQWSMTMKIDLYLKSLKECKEEIVVLLDGYDTMVLSFDNMIKKFKTTGFRILFNATRNNFPNVSVDFVPDRRYRGEACYFNAGCCIGYREDLIAFYEKCKEYINIPNPLGSEQLVVRHAFAEYSKKKDNNYVDFDYRSEIFQTFCKTSVAKVSDKSFVVL